MGVLIRFAVSANALDLAIRMRYHYANCPLASSCSAARRLRQRVLPLCRVHQAHSNRFNDSPFPSCSVRISSASTKLTRRQLMEGIFVSAVGIYTSRKWLSLRRRSNLDGQRRRCFCASQSGYSKGARWSISQQRAALGGERSLRTMQPLYTGKPHWCKHPPSILCRLQLRGSSEECKVSVSETASASQ